MKLSIEHNGRRALACYAVLIALVVHGRTARAALVPRGVLNADPVGMVALNAPNVSGPHRQTFLNNTDKIISIFVGVAGPMLSQSDTLTVQLRDGCGNAVGGPVSLQYDWSGIQTAGTYKLIEVDLGSRTVTWGNYYSFDVWTNGASPIMLNTDRFGGGRFFTGGDTVDFPAKKRDLMFQVNGKADSSKPLFAPFTTNQACPSRCVLANPSGTENKAYGPDNHFNVVIRSRTAFDSKGSFWTDFNTPGAIAKVKTEVAAMLQDAYGLKNVAPYSVLYPNMNFYIAIADPALDPSAARGLHGCANADAVIDVVDGGGGYGGVVGGMRGEVARGTPNTTGWGAPAAGILVHEVFGHGMGALADEYINTGAQPNYTNVRLAKDWFGYLPNALPLSTSGCNEWCGGTRSLSWLKTQMQSAGDFDYACWSRTTKAACTPATIPTAGQAACRWIGDLPAIPYWGTNKCIPLNVTLYNLGTNCGSNGDGCYPLAPNGDPGAIMDVVQPNESIMQSFHHAPSAPGFGTPSGTFIKDLLDCVYPLSPCASGLETRCKNLVARWGTPGNGFNAFLQSANACGTDNFIRRR